MTRKRTPSTSISRRHPHVDWLLDVEFFQIVQSKAGEAPQLCLIPAPTIDAGFKSYGMFDGVRAMLVLKGNRELAFLKEKVGYYGEQLILKATELGLGSCWVGGTFDRRSAVFEPSSEEEMVCVVPIGKVAQSSRKERMIRGVIHRKSKTIEEMVRADRPLSEEERQAMQLVQLAPTAKNTQKPVFIFAGDKIYAGVADDEPFDLVDLGICKLHFEIGMKQLFLQGHFEFGNGSIYKRS